MRKVIARVKLNPGQGGYFDPITRIHLTHGDPERDVYAGMNTEGLKAAVRNKRISLVSGSLGEFIPPFKLVKQANGKVVLVANNQKKTVQSAKTESKKTITNVQQKQEKQIIPEIKIEPVIKIKEDPKPVEEIKEQISEPDIKVEPVTAPIEQEHSEETKSTNNPFKKGKKNKAGKKDNEEIKTE